MGKSAEGASYNHMSFPTPDTHDTSSDNGIGHDDDVVSGVSTHGTGGSLFHQAAAAVVGETN